MLLLIKRSFDALHALLTKYFVATPAVGPPPAAPPPAPPAASASAPEDSMEDLLKKRLDALKMNG